MYTGVKALEGLSAGSAGSLAKGGARLLGKAGWFQFGSGSNAPMTLINSKLGLAGDMNVPEFTLTAVSLPGSSFAKAGVGKIGNMAAKGATTYTKSSLALGRQVHSGYKVAEHAPALGRFKEFTGKKGIRPDFVDFGTKTIYELKPFNPRGIQLGTKQLNNYKSIFEQNYGGKWKIILEFY